MRARVEPSDPPTVPLKIARTVERQGITLSGRGQARAPSRQLSAPARLLLFLIGLWRWTAPMRLPRCRFEPSCSVYAQQSIGRYGAARGGWRALRRVTRCHPWNPGGVDPLV